MKKIIVSLTMSLIAVVGLYTTSLAADYKPVSLVEISGLDNPYYKSSVLDTSVDLPVNSDSHFVELNWTKTENDLYKVTIKTRTSYYDHYYDENTRATINGNSAEIISIDEESKRYITFSYVFPKGADNANPAGPATLLHKFEIMYMRNGKVSPNPIRAKHRKNLTIQIIPDAGYEVEDVIIDGESVGAVTEYTFKRVTEPHKISARFKPIDGYVPAEEENEVKDENIESGEIEVVEPTNKTFYFDDVKETDWYYDVVQYVCNAGIFNGVSETEFGPNETTTREQLVTVLYRYAQNHEIDTSVGEETNILSYEDALEISEYAIEGFQWACGAGIINGTTESTLSPQDIVTREQLVTILYRFAKNTGIDVSVGEETNILSYDDAFDISEYAISPFQWACGSGIITGKTISTLAPKDFVTRAEYATMIMRFDNNK